MALPATEPFTGTGALSASWTAQTTTSVWQRTAGQAAISNTTDIAGAYWNADTFANNQYAQCNKTGNQSGPSVRAAGTTQATLDNYHWRNAPANEGLFRTDDGTSTRLTAISDAASGALVKITVSGTTLEIFYDGVSQGTTVDATYASGSAGIFGYDGSTSRLDNWEGGDVAAAGIAIPILTRQYRARWN